MGGKDDWYKSSVASTQKLVCVSVSKVFKLRHVHFQRCLERGFSCIRLGCSPQVFLGRKNCYKFVYDSVCAADEDFEMFWTFLYQDL